MVQAHDVSLGMEPSVGVHRQLPVGADASSLDKGATLSLLAKAQRLQLNQDRAGEAVVNLRYVHILGGDARHLEGPGRRLCEPKFQHVGSLGNGHGRVGVARGEACQIHGAALGVLGALGGREDHRARPVGLEAEIQTPVGLCEEGRIEVILHGDGLLDLSIRLACGVGPGVDRYLPIVLVLRAVLEHVLASILGVPLARDIAAIGPLELGADAATPAHGDLPTTHPRSGRAIATGKQQAVIADARGD